MYTIEFTEDFATKKKGEVWECDGHLASQLVHHDKVAKYVDSVAPEKKKFKKDVEDATDSK